MFKIMGYENLEFEPSYLHFMDKLLHSDDKDVVSDVLDSTKSKDISFDFVFRLRIKPGNYEWFQVKGIMHEYTKELWRSSGSLTNINQRKLNEQKIIEYTKELERINDDLDTFAYIASHDLKEPIRGLNNNAIFLKEDHAKDLSDQAMKRIDRIMFLCARMEKLVDDLLHFARLKNQQIYIKKVDLNNVVEDIKDTIDVVLFEQNAQIIMKRPLPKYVCDRIIVTELFRNLITNGVKYNKSKNKIIEVGYSEEILDKKTGLLEYVFYVKDNGIGIKKSYHKDIFKVFKRIHDDDEYIGGTGVGLTFVKKIVERHGGRIWLESTLGEGSTFYFTLSSRKIENQDE
jgi:light-regulated signal transduction histidine kinase (bacteriophytochrome)